MDKTDETNTDPLPPEACLLDQWRPAFRLALAWCAASGEMRSRGEYATADHYLQNGMDILDALEAKLC